MIYIVYIIRFSLALLFIYAGIEKLFLPYDSSVFKANNATSDPSFFEFYDLLQAHGYTFFVGFFQWTCGVLLVFKRSYLLGSIMLVPLILCLLMTHVFFSENTFYLLFDSTVLVLNTVLIWNRAKDLLPIVKPQHTLL